jgi:hypothetical protein
MRRFAAVVFFVLIATLARAQFDTATVLGTVTDASGAAVSRGSVSLRNAATAVVKTAATNELGQFQFVNVTVGPYRLEVSAPGYEISAASFELEVGARQRVDVQLRVASANSTVIATAEAAQLETDSSEHSQVVAEREIVELPLNGREYSQLVLLSTGVVPSPSQLSVGYDQREGSFNINGLRSTFNNYMLDGLDNNEYGTSNQGFSNQVVQLSPDSVAEFRVVTNNESAEYGRSGGATINVVTKYGTNQMHGRAWEFLRNTNLNATGFFKPDQGGKPALHRNQFGGNFGGPILKNKLFYFIDYEGYRESSSSTSKATLPTMSERGETASGADLGYALIDDTDASNANGYLPINNPCPYAAGSNICTTSTSFVYGLLGYYGAYGAGNYSNGQIPTSKITPFAKELLAMLPAPTNSGSNNNYVILRAITNDRDKGDAKLDYDVLPNLRLFARYSQSRANVFDPGTISGTAGGADADGHVQVPTISIASGATWTINPLSILELRFGFSRDRAGKEPVLTGGESMYDLFGIGGLPTDKRYTGGVTTQLFADGGFSTLGRQWTSPQHQYPTVWNPKVNYTRSLMSHTLKAGIEYTAIHVEQEDLHPVYGINGYAAQMSGYCYYYGSVAPYSHYCPSTFSHGTQTAESWKMFDYADFLLGYQYEIAQSSPMIANIRDWSWAGYVQDDWKLSRRLTLNLGLRYEFATPIFEANNKLGNFDPNSLSVVTASASDRYTVNPNTKDFGPRLGFAYSLTDKTVVRGGFGISYTHWNRIGSNYLTQSAPYGLVATREVYPTATETTSGGTTYYNYLNTQSGFPTNPSIVDSTNYRSQEVIIQYMPRKSPDSQIRSWFFGIQRDFGHNWVVDASYVGNHGLHEVIINDVNQASVQSSASGTASLASRRPYTNYNSVVGTLPWATSDYDGLQVKIEKRFSYGLYLLNSFTWSKAIDIAGQALDGGGNCDNCGNGIPSVQDVHNWQADRGLSNYNYPFVNSTSLVWALPVGRGQSLLPNLSRFWNNLIGGWQTTQILQARSGDPLTFAYSPSDYQEVSGQITVYGRNAYRPNQSGPAVATNKSYSQYFNSSSFSSPAANVVFGNSPRNAVRGYNFWQLDSGLSKNFSLTERSHLEFRAEAFNLFNHTNFSDPNTLYGSSTFGEIVSSLPQRELQVAGKIVF